MYTLSEHWTLQRGAQVISYSKQTNTQTVRFSVWAPFCQSLRLHLPETGVTIPMDRGDRGVFVVEVAELPEGCRYQFQLDNGQLRPDPVSRYQPEGVHGPSQVVSSKDLQWEVDKWLHVPTEELIMYELHIGTASAEGDLFQAARLIPYLKEVGVNAIELMPLAQFSGKRNWGYDGVNLYAVQNSYGGPQGLRYFVDTAHRAGMAVFLDVVYNHLGPEGNYLGEFAPYFTNRYQTPWGAALNFDDRESDQVREYIIENALYWLKEFRIDGLRLDAVHAIYDSSAYHILEELSDAVQALEAHEDRPLCLIAESDLHDPRLLRATEEGGYGLDAQWNDDFHHAVHTSLTGELQGYYSDFPPLSALTKCINKIFVHDGCYSQFRRRRHGRSTGELLPAQFVVCTQNHDQVGNRAHGERLITLSSPEHAQVAAAMMFWSPFIPLLFMGEEYGETKPFLYFVDHQDDHLRKAVFEGRQNEFKEFDWSGNIPDPSSLETFLQSMPEFEKHRSPTGGRMLAWYRALIASKQQEPALCPAQTRFSRHADYTGPVVVFRYADGEEQLLACFNTAAEPNDYQLPDSSQGWTIIMSNAEPAFQLSTSSTPSVVVHEQTERLLRMPPCSAILLSSGAQR